MEEARQHPALTPEQRLFALLYHVGSVALVISCCLQIWRRIDALYPTILAVGCSRICLAAWQLAQPGCSKTERTSGLIATIVVWACTMLILVWARRYGTAG